MPISATVGIHSHWLPIVPIATGYGNRTGPGNSVDGITVGNREDHPQKAVR